MKNTETTWTKGESQNAITSFLGSVLYSQSNPSFIDEKLPEHLQKFDPSMSTPSDYTLDSIGIGKIHNVLFIILESAGAVYFDSYGGNHHLSPNLNHYSKNALRFDNMYSHAPATNKSLVSLLGSIYPYISYKNLTKEAPAFKHPTISSILKAKGYRTSFFTSSGLSFLSSDKFLSNRGFETIEDFTKIDCADTFKQDDFKEGDGINDLCLEIGLKTG